MLVGMNTFSSEKQITVSWVSGIPAILRPNTVCFVRFDFLRPNQQFFSYVGTGLPELNQS